MIVMVLHTEAHTHLSLKFTEEYEITHFGSNEIYCAIKDIYLYTFSRMLLRRFQKDVIPIAGRELLCSRVCYASLCYTNF